MCRKTMLTDARRPREMTRRSLSSERVAAQAGRATTFVTSAERPSPGFTRGCPAPFQLRQLRVELRAVPHQHAEALRVAALVRPDHLQTMPSRCARHAAGQSRNAGVHRRPSERPGAVQSRDPCLHGRPHRSRIEPRSQPHRTTISRPCALRRLRGGGGQSATARPAGQTVHECSGGGGRAHRLLPRSKRGVAALKPCRGKWFMVCAFGVCGRLRPPLLNATLAYFDGRQGLLEAEEYLSAVGMGRQCLWPGAAARERQRTGTRISPAMRRAAADPDLNNR